ncbi:hypothetical protein PsAD2_00710 [Pseudovibrio axinellae]|uniref:Uncharacterized protein n=1 Tax=Pseudovibrio axinellae TaxID=989403 RepID=A0A166AQC6_9HYPH|nr:hypothetical protein [Pseudovibrio axinellae]KZL21418.1 hypothetical protein PsAD2_00710 [Pseudovibrio axinellae]SEQ99543.1 hypothetical protein SAMN05421798_105333 [Pseudovibrio axinellae]
MERDVTYIREELEEVILNQLRRWEGVIEQDEPLTLSSSGVDGLPGLLCHLSLARDALVKAEGVLVGDQDFSEADVILGFRDTRLEDDVERHMDRDLDDRVLQDGVEEQILARFTSTGDIELNECGEESERHSDYDR